MHEPRTPSGPRRSSGIQLMPRPSGSIAPDLPPKQIQAWVITDILFIYKI